MSARLALELVGMLEGEVLEVGAGTGANVGAYGPAVSRLVLAEPDAHMRKRLRRSATQRPGAEVTDAAVEELPFADASFDAVLSTLVLCSVRDPTVALAEIRRVLRPGGKLVFLEHVASDDPKRLAWQRRIEPVWKHIAGSCHLTRRTGEAILAAGFAPEVVGRESMRKALEGPMPWIMPDPR